MTTYVIIGASNHKEKFGYKVALSLDELHEKLVLVNPKETEILGKKVYASLTEAAEADEELDVAIFIIPPVIGRKILEEIKELNDDEQFISVWFQPGSSTPELIDYCKENNIDYINNKCIMVEKGNLK